MIHKHCEVIHRDEIPNFDCQTSWLIFLGRPTHQNTGFDREVLSNVNEKV
jgi:hypothetical protein